MVTKTMQKFNEAMDEIKAFKEYNLRLLTDDEIACIIKKYNIKYYFQKRKLIKSAKNGLDNINILYGKWMDLKKDLTISDKKFLDLSLVECERKIKLEGNYIAETDFYTCEQIEEYNRKIMKLVYVKKMYGYSIVEYKSFMHAYEDLYDEVFYIKKKNLTKKI